MGQTARGRPPGVPGLCRIPGQRRERRETQLTKDRRIADQIERGAILGRDAEGLEPEVVVASAGGRMGR